MKDRLISAALVLLAFLCIWGWLDWVARHPL